jgi:hypothetical protein
MEVEIGQLADLPERRIDLIGLGPCVNRQSKRFGSTLVEHPVGLKRRGIDGDAVDAALACLEPGRPSRGAGHVPRGRESKPAALSVAAALHGQAACAKRISLALRYGGPRVGRQYFVRYLRS